VISFDHVTALILRDRLQIFVPIAALKSWKKEVNGLFTMLQGSYGRCQA
jgi:hypothetical protein